MLAGIAAPISLLEECAARSHAHVALTHLIELSPEYRDFYLRMSKRGDLVIVDNSVVEEREAANLPRLLAAAKEVEAQEIILPDVIGNGSRTVAKVVHALAELREMRPTPPYQIMAVAQGSNMIDFLTSYLYLTSLTQIDTIGLTMFWEQTMGASRRSICCDLLVKWHLLSHRHEYHCLGCWRDVREFTHINKIPHIRSADTGLPVRMGIKHQKCSWFGRPARQEHRGFDFFKPYRMNDIIESNIRLYKRACNDC